MQTGLRPASAGFFLSGGRQLHAGGQQLLPRRGDPQPRHLEDPVGTARLTSRAADAALPARVPVYALLTSAASFLRA
jgi:hypothetical protein